MCIFLANVKIALETLEVEICVLPTVALTLERRPTE